MENLNDLIKIAKHRQKLADDAIYAALQELKTMFCSQNAYEEAEEAVLLYIYEGTDTKDKQITLGNLIRNIKSINKVERS
ncbi:MAG: hypothetical protein NC452_20525 [Eubacterium sp.]|nr:hypothetical protein [Eubacterium sp.]